MIGSLNKSQMKQIWKKKTSCSVQQWSCLSLAPAVTLKLFPLNPLPVNLQKIIIISILSSLSSSSPSSYRNDHHHHHRPVNVQQIWFHYPKKVQPCVTPSTSASFLQLRRSDFLWTKTVPINQTINQTCTYSRRTNIWGACQRAHKLEVAKSHRHTWSCKSLLSLLSWLSWLSWLSLSSWLTRGAASLYYLDYQGPIVWDIILTVVRNEISSLSSISIVFVIPVILIPV